MWDGAQVQLLSHSRCWAGVSEAFAPDPADPESEHPLTHGTLCLARDRVRGWWVGGWPKVCV